MGDSHLLASIGMATAFVNIFGYSILQGFITAFYTLASQAFGAENYELVGRFFNNVRVIILALSICFFPVFYFADQALQLMGVQESTAELAGTFTKITYVGWVLNIQGNLASTFLKSQEVTCPQMLFNLGQFSLHLLLLHIFTDVYSLGLEGVCYSILIINSLNFCNVYLIIFCNCRNVYKRETRVKCSRSQFQTTCTYIKTAVPAAFMMMVEWLVYDMLLILVAPLGQVSVAAQTIIVNLQNFLYIMSQGWQDAIQSLVSQKIGANQPKEAKRITLHVFAIGVFFESILILLLYFLRRKIIRTMVIEEQVDVMIIGCMGQVAAQLFFDLLQGLLNAVMRALNFMKTSLISMIICFYVFFMPLAVGLGVHMGFGIWLIQIFLAIAMLSLAVIFIICIFGIIDWKKVAEAAFAKMALDRGTIKTEMGTDELSSNRRLNRPTSISPLS